MSVLHFFAQDGACNALKGGKRNLTPTSNIFDSWGRKKKQKAKQESRTKVKFNCFVVGRICLSPKRQRDHPGQGQSGSPRWNNELLSYSSVIFGLINDFYISKS